jgi:hypothetical protein
VDEICLDTLSSLIPFVHGSIAAHAEAPPSMTRSWPTANPASGEASQSTVAAASVRVPARPAVGRLQGAGRGRLRSRRGAGTWGVDGAGADGVDPDARCRVCKQLRHGQVPRPPHRPPPPSQPGDARLHHCVSSAYTPFNGYYPLAPWAGFAVLCGYAAVALALAIFLLRQRDA